MLNTYSATGVRRTRFGFISRKKVLSHNLAFRQTDRQPWITPSHLRNLQDFFNAGTVSACWRGEWKCLIYQVRYITGYITGSKIFEIDISVPWKKVFFCAFVRQ